MQSCTPPLGGEYSQLNKAFLMNLQNPITAEKINVGLKTTGTICLGSPLSLREGNDTQVTNDTKGNSRGE
jgi:hypothetical protein